MKVLIFLAMLIVFISAFFMFFIYETSIKEQLGCYFNRCPPGQSGSLVILGAAGIIGFLLLSLGAVYVVYKTLTREINLESAIRSI